MTWFYVDDHFHDHKKARRSELEAIGLWTMSGSWCADNLTDGFVPRTVAPRWAGSQEAADRIGADLVRVGLWFEDEEDGEIGWRFHDWEDVQKTREEVLSQREKRSAAGRKGGIRSGATRKGEASFKHASGGTSSHPEVEAPPPGEAPHEANAQANAEANASRLVEAESNPVPSRPVPYSVPTERADEPPRTDPSPPPDETEGQRVNRLTKTYTDQVPLSKFPAVMGIVRKAVRAGRNGNLLYDDQQIIEALGRLATEGRGVTEESLRAELDGFAAPRRLHVGAQRPNTSQRVASVQALKRGPRKSPEQTSPLALGGASA